MRNVLLAWVVGAAVALSLTDVAHAAAPPPAVLEVGGLVRHSTVERNLTVEDRARLGELGLVRPSSAAVLFRKIPRSEGARQLARLQALAHAPEGFAPSGACDEMTSTGDANALCSGHVAGPLGSVPVRMPVAAKLVQQADGSVRLSLSNPKPLEAKPLFSWSSVVAPQRLQVVYELYPDPDGWLVYVRVGVEMTSHESSARTISDAMLKLEAWLTHELART